MTRPIRDAWLRRAMVLGGDRAAPPGCLDDEQVAGLVDGRLDPTARAAALDHLARCAACRSAVASVARALSDPFVSEAVAETTREGRRALSRAAVSVAAMAAAAAVILLVSWPPSGPEPELTHRAPTITAGTTPAPVTPVGTVTGGRTFRWLAVDGADRYRVTVFDVDGGVVHEQELTRAAMVLPDSVVLRPGGRYLWKVEARLGFDRWAASDLVEFTVSPDGPP